jgi:hypothetical protein
VEIGGRPTQLLLPLQPDWAARQRTRPIAPADEAPSRGGAPEVERVARVAPPVASSRDTFDYRDLIRQARLATARSTSDRDEEGYSARGERAIDAYTTNARLPPEMEGEILPRVDLRV